MTWSATRDGADTPKTTLWLADALEGSDCRSLERYLRRIHQKLEHDDLNRALEMSATLPEICSMLEHPQMRTSPAHCVCWCDAWVATDSDSQNVFSAHQNLSAGLPARRKRGSHAMDQRGRAVRTLGVRIAAQRRAQLVSPARRLRSHGAIQPWEGFRLLRAAQRHSRRGAEACPAARLSAAEVARDAAQVAGSILSSAPSSSSVST